jgi:hypothetical protein
MFMQNADVANQINLTPAVDLLFGPTWPLLMALTIANMDVTNP